MQRPAKVHLSGGGHSRYAYIVPLPIARSIPDSLVVDVEYDIPLPGSCQSADNFTPTVMAIDNTSNVIKALTPPGEGTQCVQSFSSH